MTRRHLIQVRIDAPPVATAVTEVVRPLRPQVKALRFAVSLTSPQGTEVFRKQFGSPAEADSFARATAELCPDYKVSSVDRLEGFAYELKGQELTITASPARGRGIGQETIRESRI